MSGRAWLGRLGLALGLLVAMLPASVVITILLMPLWSWVEARWHIESVGHSGPADWCFISMYAVSVAASGGLWAGIRRRYPSRPD